jgi:hypothetical protein
LCEKNMLVPHGEGVGLVALTDQGLATPGMGMRSDALLCPLSQYTPTNTPEHPGRVAERDGLTLLDRLFLLQLQKQALQYFLDNQMANGLILDRQRNTGPPETQGICSMAATGMGLIALALAAAPPFRLLSPSHAAARIRTALETVRQRVPHDRGVIPHFLHSATGAILGQDHFSTIETAWLLAGALWAGSFLKDKQVETLADQLYERVDWHHWTAAAAPGGGDLLRHAKGRDRHFFDYTWDRLNGETAFMYVLAAGAAEGQALSAKSWTALRPFYGTVAGLRFNNADLGLFVFQYGLDLLDLYQWRAPGEVDLLAEAKLATLANQQVCRQAAATFATYRTYWGLSAGDGPGDPPQRDTYRCYAPAGPMDGTAHLMATLAAVAHHPAAVLENLRAAQHDVQWRAHGRYGFSNLNVDRSWVGRDVIGIDAGAAVLALDNFLMHGRVRAVFGNLPCVRLGMDRLGFTARATASANPYATEERQTLRQAS